MGGKCASMFFLYGDKEKKKKKLLGENKLAFFISFLKFDVDACQSSRYIINCLPNYLLGKWFLKLFFIFIFYWNVVAGQGFEVLDQAWVSMNLVSPRCKVPRDVVRPLGLKHEH